MNIWIYWFGPTEKSLIVENDKSQIQKSIEEFGLTTSLTFWSYTIDEIIVYFKAH